MVLHIIMQDYLLLAALKLYCCTYLSKFFNDIQSFVCLKCVWTFWIFEEITISKSVCDWKLYNALLLCFANFTPPQDVSFICVCGLTSLLSHFWSYIRLPACIMGYYNHMIVNYLTEILHNSQIDMITWQRADQFLHWTTIYM